MLNVLATPKDKTQRQILSFINSLFISLFKLQGRVAQRPINSLLFKTPYSAARVTVNTQTIDHFRYIKIQLGSEA